MKLFYLLILVCCFGFQGIAQPPNNEPCNAILLINGEESCGTNLNATSSIDLDSLPCPELSRADVWYSFIVTAPNTMVNFSFTNVNIDGDALVILGQWSSGCSGIFTYQKPAYCGQLNDVVYSCLSPGTYYLMVSSSIQDAGEFCVTATQNGPPQGCAVHDACLNALNSAVPPGVGIVCVSSCNTGACVEYNLDYQGCRLDIQATVWHTFTTGPQTNLIYVMNTSGGGHTISLFSGDCGSLRPLRLCQSDINGIVLPPNTTYYVAISTPHEDAGTYNFCISTFENPSVCARNNSVEVLSTSYGSPLKGPYQQGETVRFCLKVNDWDASQNNCQWLHGIVPLFGRGWDISSFDPLGMPNNNSYGPNRVHINEGYWDWFTDVSYNSVVNPATATRRIYTDLHGNIRICNIFEPSCDPSYPILTIGETLPGGWFVCRQAGSQGPCPINWGDGASCGPGNGPWSVCFDLKTKEFEEDNCEELTYDDVDCSVKFYTMADGETGSWSAFDCAGDIPAIHNAYIYCCVRPMGDEFVDTICSGNTTNLILTSDQEPVSYKWTVSTPSGVFGSSSGSGSGIYQNLINTTSNTQQVKYIITPTNDSTLCVGPAFEVLVDVHPQIQIDIVTDPADKLGCVSTPFELNANTQGGSGGDYTFVWSSGEPNDESSILVTPGVVGSFTYHVTVSDENACTEEEQVTIEVLANILAKLELEKSIFSEEYIPKILSIETNPSTIVTSYSWINPGLPTPNDQAFISIYESGYYAVTITDINGCIGEDEMEIDRVQLINNTNMDMPDVYWGDVKIFEGLDVKHASPYILLDVSNNDVLGIAPTGSSSSEDVFVHTAFNLPKGINRVAMFAGIEADIDFPISIFIKDSARIEALDPDNLDIVFFHGSTNAPKLDVEMKDIGLLAENVEYGQFSNYVEAISADLTIELIDTKEEQLFKFYRALFEIYRGNSMILFAGGIVKGDPGFELWAALSNGTSFPLEELVASNTLDMISSYKLHPNPVNENWTTLTLNTIQECTQCVIELMDIKGVSYKQMRLEKLNVGQHDFNIEVTDLISGLYRVNIHCAQGRLSLPLIVNR